MNTSEINKDNLFVSLVSLCMDIVLEQPILTLLCWFDVYALQGRYCNQIVGIAREVVDVVNVVDLSVGRHRPDYLRDKFVFF